MAPRHHIFSAQAAAAAAEDHIRNAHQRLLTELSTGHAKSVEEHKEFRSEMHKEVGELRTTCSDNCVAILTQQVVAEEQLAQIVIGMQALSEEMRDIRTFLMEIKQVTREWRAGRDGAKVSAA